MNVGNQNLGDVHLHRRQCFFRDKFVGEYRIQEQYVVATCFTWLARTDACERVKLEESLFPFAILQLLTHLCVKHSIDAESNFES